MTKEEKDKVFLDNTKLIMNKCKKIHRDHKITVIEAEDVYQEAYLKWISTVYLDESKVKPLDFILNIIYQVYIDFYRRETRRFIEPYELDYIENEKITTKITSDQIFDEEIKFFNKISGFRRERNINMLELIRLGYSNKDICKKLSCDESSVKQFKDRLIKRVKKYENKNKEIAA